MMKKQEWISIAVAAVFICVWLAVCVLYFIR